MFISLKNYYKELRIWLRVANELNLFAICKFPSFKNVGLVLLENS